MKIGLIGAIPEEIRFFESLLSGKKKRTVGNSKFIQGCFNNHSITIGFSRCGKVAAADVTSILIHIFKVELVVFIGIAGGTDSSLNAGDIVIANELVQYDMDASASTKHEKFEIPELGINKFRVDLRYLVLAQKAIINFWEESLKKDKLLNLKLKDFKINTPKVICGLIGTGDQFIADKEKIRLLKEKLPDLMCVEMEGAAVAQICYCHNIPFLIIRIISDNADKNAYTDYPIFISENGAYLICSIAKKVIEGL